MSGGYLAPLSIVRGFYAVTNPDGTGQKFTLFKADRDLVITGINTSVTTAIGAGTIQLIVLNGGTLATSATTIVNHTTATAWTANLPVAETVGNATITTGQVVTCLIKGDGTLDMAYLSVQIDYVVGNPAGAG